MKYLKRFNEGCFEMNPDWLDEVEGMTELPLSDMQDILQEYIDDYDLIITNKHWKAITKGGLYYQCKIYVNNLEIQIISVDKFNAQGYQEVISKIKSDFQNRLKDEKLIYQTFDYHYGDSGYDNKLFRLLIFNSEDSEAKLLDRDISFSSALNQFSRENISNRRSLLRFGSGVGQARRRQNESHITDSQSEGEYHMELINDFLQDIRDEEFDIQVNDIGTLRGSNNRTDPAWISILVFFVNNSHNDFEQAMSMVDRNRLLLDLIKEFLQRVQNTNQYTLSTLKLTGPKYGYWIKLKAKDLTII